MAGNQLANAAFLEGAANWTAVSGALSVSESGRGGPGRAVLVSAQGAISAGVAVSAGATIEAAGLFGDTGGAAALRVVINSGGSTAQLDLPVDRVGRGPARHGAANTLSFAYGQVTAPISGQACLVVVGSGEVWLSKPYLDASPPVRDAYQWDPGVFSSPDLVGYARWPVHLPPVLLEGFEAKATPIRKALGADAQRETTQRIAGTPAYRMAGRLRVNQAELYDLELFHETTDVFLMTRPDTGQLCRAQWIAEAGPAPEPTGIGDFYVGFGVELEVL